MSKMVSSLLCDFVVPVVGGSLFEALATMATLCGEMKENEVVCRRVYDRLLFVYEELQKCSDASSLHESRVLMMYGCAMAQFLAFLEKHSQKRLLRRLIESSRVAARIQEFHEEIDELFKLLSIVHMTEMSAWRQEWEQDRTFQRNMLHEALAEARCVHNINSPSNSVATLSVSTSSGDSEVGMGRTSNVKTEKSDFLDTEQYLVVREKELEEAIRDYIGENGYDVCSVLDLLRSLPDASLALRGAAVLHELELELQPEVLSSPTVFIQEFICSLANAQDSRSSYARQMAERHWLEWFLLYVRNLVQGDSLMIQNAANYEYLGANNKSKLDSTWRRIVARTGNGTTWTPTDNDLEVQWRLVPENETKTLFRVVNLRYPYECLHATVVRYREGSGFTEALSSQPGTEQDLPEALWELQLAQPIGGNQTFLLVNAQTGGYLCSADTLDCENRLVLVVSANTVDSGGFPSTNRCTWILGTIEEQDADRIAISTGADENGSIQIPLVPEAAREFAALELVIRDLFENSNRDLGMVVSFLSKLPEPKHVLFGCSIARAVDLEASKCCPARRDSLVLPFFVHALATKLPADSKVLAQQYWCHWFSPVVKAIVLGRGLLLETMVSGTSEYLVAPADKLQYDEHQRPVVVWSGENRGGIRTGSRSEAEWTPSADNLEGRWSFVPVDATCTVFRVINYRYPYEEMRAMDSLRQRYERSIPHHYVVTARPKSKTTCRTPRSFAQAVGGNNSAGDTHLSAMSAHWELSQVGENSFQLFHPQSKTVLCPTEDKLDKHRCFAMLKSSDKNTEISSRWHFRLPLGLE